MDNDIVKVDYDKLKELAQRFRGSEAEIYDLYKKVGRVAEHLLSEGWIGAGAKAFEDDLYDEVLPAVRRLFEALEVAAMLVNQIINIFQQAEQDAAAPFSIHPPPTDSSADVISV